MRKSSWQKDCSIRTKQNSLETIIQEIQTMPLMTHPPMNWSGRVSQPPERYGHLLQGKHKLYDVAEGNMDAIPLPLNALSLLITSAPI